MVQTRSTSGFGRFVSELRRRHVVRVALAYGAVGFVLLQAAEIVLPAFLPGFEADAALRVVVVAFLVLFPVVVALAWVYEITPQGIRAMESIDAEAGRPPTGRLMPRLALLVFTVTAAGTAGLWWYRTDSAALDEAEARRAARQTPFVAASTTDASGPIRSLAVLPLEDFSPEGDDSQAYFAAGMHEALISQLSQLGTVRVISRTSTEGYRRTGKSLPQIGSELGVDAVVEGSVLRADGRVRITVQLVHAASDSHLWARDYERELADIIALQREVATAIAGEIETRVQRSETPEALADRGDSITPAAGDDAQPSTMGESVGAVGPVPALPPAPVAPEVQDAVMRGRFALRDGGDARTEEAERYFEEALARDSTFVPALTGLAGAHLLRGLEAAGSEGLRELIHARETAVRAVRRDSASIEAREVLASTEEALAEFGVRMVGIASDLEEGARMVHLGGDSVFLIEGGDTTRFARGEAPTPSATEIGRLVQVALANDTGGERTAEGEFRSIVRFEIAGRHDAALARAHQAVDRFPESPLLWDVLERLTVSAGSLDAAVEIRRRRAESLDPVGPGPESLARSVARDGIEGYWTWKLRELDARVDAGLGGSRVDRAAALSALGRTDEALELLEAAVEARDPRLVSLRTDPVWDPLRPEARFKALLRSLGPRVRPGPAGGRR